MKKHKTFLIIILLLLLTGIYFFLYYFNEIKVSDNTDIDNQVILDNNTIDDNQLNSLTYVDFFNDEMNISLEYPESWLGVNGNCNINGLETINCIYISKDDYEIRILASIIEEADGIHTTVGRLNDEEYISAKTITFYNSQIIRSNSASSFTEFTRGIYYLRFINPQSPNSLDYSTAYINNGIGYNIQYKIPNGFLSESISLDKEIGGSIQIQEMDEIVKSIRFLD